VGKTAQKGGKMGVFAKMAQIYTPIADESQYANTIKKYFLSFSLNKNSKRLSIWLTMFV